MNKLILPLLLICIITCELNAQKYEAELILGYQESDRRFWGDDSDFVGKEGFSGTSYLGFRVNRNLHQSEKYSLQVGLGYARETNTYSTPYDHCFDNPGAPCTEILLLIDNYSIDLLQTSFAAKYQLTRDFGLNIDLIPQFYFHKEVSGYKGYNKTSDGTFGLYTIEIVPKIEYQFDRFYMTLGYRLFQFKTIDNVYLYGGDFLMENPGYLDRAFDTYNPIKFILTAGIVLGKK